MRNALKLGLAQKKRFQGGFTLIEVLVIIAIIVILSGVVFINYRSSEKTLALQRAANKLAQDIRRVQEMAIAAQVCCGGTVPPGGYGIYLGNVNDTSYILYADKNNSGDYSPAGNERIETINLEQGVKISLLNPSSPSINFKPPDPTITLTGGGPVEITLVLESDTSKTKKITVNKAGLVEIE